MRSNYYQSQSRNPIEREVGEGEDLCERCHSNLYASNSYMNNEGDSQSQRQRQYSARINGNNMIQQSNDYYPFQPQSLSQSQFYGVTYQKEDNKQTNASTSLLSHNYINDIKSIYEKDKELLEERLLCLSHELDTTKTNYNNELCSMHQTLLKQDNSSKSSLESLSKEHSLQLKKITAEKDTQISMLIKKNNELTKYNEDLLTKLDGYLNQMNDTKMSLSARISNTQSETDHLKNEMKRLKDFYEKKIAFCTSEGEDEKNKLIYSYDNTIEKLKQESLEEREGLLKTIEDKDNELKDAYEANRKEQERYINLNTEYKRQQETLNEEIALLSKSNRELQETNDKLTNDLKQSKKETKAVLNEKLKYEGQSDQLLRENSNLKIYNDKLNRLTHGKIKK